MAEQFAKQLEGGDLQGSLTELDAAVSQDDSNVALLLFRAATNSRLGNDTECEMDLRTAFQTQPDAARAALGMFQSAFSAPKFQLALEKVQSSVQPIASAAAAAPAPAPTPTPAPRIAHDWYQSDKQVVVTILLRGCTKEQITAHFEEKSASVDIQLPAGSTYNLELDLFGEIVPAESTVHPLSTKVEVRLRKREPVRWATLEGDGGAAPAVRMAAAEDIKVKPPRNWDKLVAEEIARQGEDKPEGEAALNELFKKIYGEGSDEVRRAMNKSFSESGGTVLSTNWNEIGAKPTELKAPDGMEWKKY